MSRTFAIIDFICNKSASEGLETRVTDVDGRCFMGFGVYFTEDEITSPSTMSSTMVFTMTEELEVLLDVVLVVLTKKENVNTGESLCLNIYTLKYKGASRCHRRTFFV